MTICNLIREQNGVLLARVSGPLDGTTKGKIKLELKPYVETTGVRHVALDFTYCSKIDSSGLQSMCDLSTYLNRKKCNLSLVFAPQRLVDLLEMTKLDEVITPYLNSQQFLSANPAYVPLSIYLNYDALQKASKGVI